MPSHALKQLPSASCRLLIAATLLAGAGCSTGPGKSTAAAAGTWTQHIVDAVSRPVAGSGLAAVTGLRKDQTLETDVTDLKTGRPLWNRPATMAGRLPGMGVQPPAIVGGNVVALEPAGSTPLLVARDGRTGIEKWTRHVGATYGPVRCGGYVCVSEDTTRKGARFAVVDAATGRTAWQLPGIGEVEWSDASRVVVFRMAEHPVLEAHDLQSGKTEWTYPVERAVGTGVNLSGGWAFASLGPAGGDLLVGYIAPYQEKQGKALSSFGFFGVRTSDGAQVWARPGLLRLYPGAAPAVALLVREIDDKGRYSAFAQLDPRTGQTTSEISADKAPHTPWWLAFPSDLSALGFLTRGHKGVAYDLRRAVPVSPTGMQAWSFCTITPTALPIKGQRDFYPMAALCAYDLATGQKIPAAKAGPPPGWYTGATDGWRLWRDETGALHGVHDAEGTIPGMYG